MSVLEQLIESRRSISEGPVLFDFNWWHSCTCGHIYRVTHDGQMDYGDVARSESMTGEYRSVLEIIARANSDLLPTVPSKNPATLVSDLTGVLSAALSCLGRPNIISDREAAIKLLDNAIEYVKREEREAMLAVKSGQHEHILAGD